MSLQSAQSAYDELWERATRRFPQLVTQYGQAPPRDASGNPRIDVLDAYRELREQAAAPQQDLAAVREAARTAPSYFAPTEWPRRVGQLIEGITSLPLLGSILPSQSLDRSSFNPVGAMMKRSAEASAQLPPGSGYWKKLLAGSVGSVKPQLQAMEAMGEIMAPATGALMTTRDFGEQETILPRYNAARDQGLDPVSAYAWAYESSKAAGEIPWWKSMIAETLTGPEELLPGGLALGAFGTGARGLKAAAKLAPKAVAKQVPEAAKQVPEAAWLQKGLPRSLRYQRLMEATPKAAAKQAFDEWGPEGAWMQKGLPLAEATPLEQAYQLSGVRPRVARDPWIPDISAEELMRRQAEAPGLAPDVARPTQLWAGSPDATVWDPTTGQWLTGLHKWDKATKSKPGGWVSVETEGLREWDRATKHKPGGWVLTEAGEQARQQARQMDVATDIRQAAPAHPFDELVTDAIKDPLDTLVRYRGLGRLVHTNFGYRAAHAKTTDQVAMGLFGEANDQTRRSVNDYVRHLTGERAVKAEVEAAQMKLPYATPLEELYGLAPKFSATRKPLVNLEDYFYKDPQTDQWIRRTDVPQPGQSTWRTHSESIELTKYINRFASLGGLPAVMGRTSKWLGQWALREKETAKEMAITIEDMVPAADEIAFGGMDWGEHWAPWAKGKFQAAFRAFGGVTRDAEANMEDIILNGRRELQEMKWLDKHGRATEEGLGTLENPGGLRILAYTLHDKVPEGAVDQLAGEWGVRLTNEFGDDAVRQYHNLRSLANWEEAHSIDAGLINASNADELYFYRGWTTAPDPALPGQNYTWLKVTTNRGNFLKRQSFQQQRNDALFPEMEKIGFAPTFWNLYELAMMRSRQGVQARLQIQLLDMLKNPLMGLARYAKTKGELAEYTRDGWEEVRHAGPGFKDNAYVGVHRKFTDEISAQPPVPNKGEHAVVYEPRWVFPKNVASSLEEMFATRKQPWAWMRQQKRLPVLGVDVKFDDLFYVPKRAKLFGSLFQQADFAFRAGFGGTMASTYRVIEGMKLLAQGGVAGDKEAIHRGFRHLVESHTHLANVPKAWRDMARANVSPGFREQLRRELLSTTPFYDDPALAMYHMKNLVRHGLHIRDATILDTEDGIKLLREAAKRGRVAGGAAKLGRGLKDIEMAMRRGMFDGLYPAAIMHDVKYNMVPLVRAMNPDMTPEQIMSLVAKLTNKRWSTIPVEQSVIRGHMREALLRFSFSLNENESFFRMMTGAFRGPDKAFWLLHWGSAFLFTAGVANLIHFATTTRFKKDEKGRYAGVDWGDPLPRGRYIPFHLRGWYTLAYGYRQEFLSPDFPVLTRSDDKAMLDLLMQFDFMFRLADGAYGIPGLSFVNARMGTTPRALLTLGTSRDYMDRDIGEWGYLQKAMQFVYDELAPIGAGQVAVAAARAAFKDRDIPELTPSIPGTGFEVPIIRKGATIDRITPSTEAKLGPVGIVFQGTGLNLKSPTNEALRNNMVLRTFGGGRHPDYPEFNPKSGFFSSPWQQLKKHPDAPLLSAIMYQDAGNIRELREIGERQREGAEYWYDDFGKMIAEIHESARKRLEDEASIVEDRTKMLWNPRDPTAWSPSDFREDLRVINAAHRTRKETTEDIYGGDPRVAAMIESREEKPDRAKEPLAWAIWEWGRSRRENMNPATRKVNHKAANAQWEALIGAHDDETAEERGESASLSERFYSWLDQGEHHPFVQQYYDALGVIDDSGYWQDTDFESSPMPALKQAFDSVLAPMDKTADQIWSEYLEASAEDRRRYQSHHSFAVSQTIKSMESARKAHRYKTVMENPEIDQLLIMWFGNVPHIYQNGTFYASLYGKPPKSYRQPR